MRRRADSISSRVGARRSVARAASGLQRTRPASAKPWSQPSIGQRPHLSRKACALASVASSWWMGGSNTSWCWWNTSAPATTRSGIPAARQVKARSVSSKGEVRVFARVTAVARVEAAEPAKGARTERHAQPPRHLVAPRNRRPRCGGRRAGRVRAAGVAEGGFVVKRLVREGGREVVDLPDAERVVQTERGDERPGKGGRRQAVGVEKNEGVAGCCRGRRVASFGVRDAVPAVAGQAAGRGEVDLASGNRRLAQQGRWVFAANSYHDQLARGAGLAGERIEQGRQVAVSVADERANAEIHRRAEKGERAGSHRRALGTVAHVPWGIVRRLVPSISPPA